MDLEQRVNLLARLGQYILEDAPSWQTAKERAQADNNWFIPEFIDTAAHHIANSYLRPQLLRDWALQYQVPPMQPSPKKVGIVMAGNIPLVGFHDFLATFIAGHQILIKPSSKDTILIHHLVEQLKRMDGAVSEQVALSELLKGCDAYIATGSNNSARYFDYYFSRFPHIIRRNRTSVAILTGNETQEQLARLADDVYMYFGLGCRNVTKLYVPRNFDFVPLLEAFKKYNYLADHNKYRNNYDYQLAILIINKRYYMTNGSIILREEENIFSPISELNYSYFDDASLLAQQLQHNEQVQCVVGENYVPFGKAQFPALDDFADGINTLQFLLKL